MKLNVGAGTTQLEGFVNIDVRATGPDTRRGHAGDLSFAGDGVVDVVFTHAVFEHVFLAQRLAVLREWRRALAPGGTIVCLGLPDFRAVARAYVSGGPGTTSAVFDLFEVYRYTHGHPEGGAAPGWKRWNPARHVNSAPAGYVPQLHKSLFDEEHLSNLLQVAGLSDSSLVRYVYPGEEPKINLGFVAGAGCREPAEVRRRIEEIPGLERFCRLETIEVLPLRRGADRLLGEISRLEAIPSRGVARRLAGKLRRLSRRSSSRECQGRLKSDPLAPVEKWTTWEGSRRASWR